MNVSYDILDIPPLDSILGKLSGGAQRYASLRVTAVLVIKQTLEAVKVSNK